jgi:hypothetical protein
MRSWVFRNRSRLEALLGRSGPARPVREGAASPSRSPRVVVLQPAPRAGGAIRGR